MKIEEIRFVETVDWSPPGTFITPVRWHELGEITIPSIKSGEIAVVGPLVWDSVFIPSTGHYCFIAILDALDDPAPEVGSIDELADFHNFIRNSNNTAWKNFNVVNMVPGGYTTFNFQIQGHPADPITTDLEIDLNDLPHKTETELRILKRLAEEADITNMKYISNNPKYNKYSLQAGKVASIRNIPLKKGDNTQALLAFTLPEEIKHAYYRVIIRQMIEGETVGQITHVLSIGALPLIGNRQTKEVHTRKCKWVAEIKAYHKIPFADLELALKRGFNGCWTCLPEFDKDNRRAMMKTIEGILIDSFYDDPTQVTDEELKKLTDIEERIVDSIKKTIS